MSPVRNTLLYTVSIACVVVYAFLSTGTVAYAARTAIVQVDKLNLRAKPDMQSRAIAVLAKNTRVALLP